MGMMTTVVKVAKGAEKELGMVVVARSCPAWPRARSRADVVRLVAPPGDNS